jgi:hypothetical protein
MKQFPYSRIALITVLIGFTCFWLSIRKNPSSTKNEAAAPVPSHQSIRKMQNDKGKFDFTQAKNQVKQVLSLIRNRYELDGPYGGNFFLTANNIDELSWNILKYKLAHKILLQNESFLMIFGGSSVTAGHDNLFNQSYPLIFRSRMQKIFEAIGVKLVVHNIAQGANNCIPYTHCYESMGGMNPDFLGWEQVFSITILTIHLLLCVFCSHITVDVMLLSLKLWHDWLVGHHCLVWSIFLRRVLGYQKIVLSQQKLSLTVPKIGHLLLRD